MKKKYIVDGKVYEIPDSETEGFLKEFPHAKVSYNVEGKEYQIPHDEADAFEMDMGLKKKGGTSDSSNGASKSTQVLTDDQLPTVGLGKENIPAQVEESDPISQALKSDKLRGQKETISNGAAGLGMGTTSTETTDNAAVALSNGIDKDLEKQGYNSKQLASEFNDFPTEAFNAHNTSKETLLQLRKDNPIQYQERLNNTKTTYQIAKNSDVHTANQFNDLNRENFGSLSEFIDAKKAQQEIIDRTLTGDDRNIAQKRLADNASKFINPYQPELVDEYNQSPLKDKVDATQYAGLKTEEIFNPEKYKRDIAILSAPDEDRYAVNLKGDISYTTTNKDEAKKLGGQLTQVSIDKQIGKERLLRELNEQGKQNSIQAIQKEQYNLSKQFENTTDENEKDHIRQQYVESQNKMKDIQQSENQEAQKFPLTEKLKLDNLLKEANQTTDQNLFSYAGNKFLKGFNNTQDTWEDLVTNIAGSDKDKALLQEKRLGETERWDNKMYLPTSLTKSQNLFSKANAYKVAGFTGDVANFMAQTAIGGGGRAAELATLFNTTYSDAFNNATEEGKSSTDAHEEGLVHGGIMMLAGLFGSKYEQVQKILGEAKSPLAKEIAGMGEEAWDAVINKNKGTISKIAKSVGEVGKEQAKMIATYGVGTSIATDLADKGFFNKDISTGEVIDHAVNAAKDMAIGGVALAGVGFLNRIRKNPVTQMDKNNIWENGDNPEIGKVRVDEAVSKGDISPQEGELRKKAIDNISDHIQKVPNLNDRGKPLSEKQKVDYLYNLVMKDKAIEASKDLPEKQSQEAQMKSLVAEHANQIITQQPTDKQLETRKSQLEKALVPEKDAEGKNIEIPEKELMQTNAELEAVNNEIAEREKKSKVDEAVTNAIEQTTTGNNPKPNLTNEEPQATENEVPDAETQTGDTNTEHVETGSETEAGQAEENTTGVKKVKSNEVRAANNLPKVEFPKMTTDVEALNEAKERVDSGKVIPHEMVDDILTNKRGYKDDAEVMDMQYYSHQLERRSQELDNEYAQAKTPEEQNNVTQQKLQLSDLRDAQTEAALTAGHLWGTIGNRMSPVINNAGDIFRENKVIIKQAYGGEVPKEVQLKIDAITKERDAALAAKAKVEEQLRQKMAEKGFEEVKKQASHSAKNKETKDALKKEEQDLLKQWKDLGKPDENSPQRQGIGLTDKHIALIGKLAINYIKQGVNGAEALINKLHDNLKATGISRDQIKDAIANYKPLEEAKEVKRLNTKADLLDKKLYPEETETAFNTSLPEYVDLTKPAREYKTFRKSNEWVKANQRVANAEHQMKIEKRKAFESQKNLFQKGLAWVGRLTRLSVLSGYNVLGKLAAAATIGSAVKRIPEQAIGAIYSKVFSGISKKAPIEGQFNWLNAKSEIRFYREFGHYRWFKSIGQILATGTTSLSRRLGTAEYEHVPLLYLPTDLHQIIKDPPKRATFEASFRNGMIWAEKNGLDISDPLVVNSIENAAYKRAQYEIFQESNKLSRWFVSQKAALEKQGNIGGVKKLLVDIMIPVSTVPTNIVRRLTTTSPLGLIRGGKEVVEAYRKGIESLTEEQADHVMQQLKQGTLGTALWMIGWYGASAFGGLYSQFNPNSKRDENDKVSDEMEIGGKMVPKPVQHALPLELIQVAATARHIYDNYRDNKNASVLGALGMAAIGAAGAALEQIPIIETPVHAVMATKDPVEAEKLKEDLTRRVEPQILRETGVIKGTKLDTKIPEWKYLDDKGLKLTQPHKENVHVVDKNGKKVHVSDSQFQELKDTREKLIKDEVAKAKKSGFINWETGETIDADKITKKQLERWLMSTSTKATKEATDKVFGEQPAKPPKPKLETVE